MAINKLFIVIGAAAAGGLLWLATSTTFDPAPPGSTSAGLPPALPERLAALQAELDQCKSFANPEGNTLDWDKAVEHCDAALTIEPTLKEARRAKKLAEKERVQKKIYDEGRALARKGEDLAALAVFTQLETESIYFRPARAEVIRDAFPRAKRTAGACLAAHQRGDDQEAWKQCRAAADVFCHMGWPDDEDETQTIFEGLKAAHNQPTPWVCPEASKRFIYSWSCGEGLDDRRKVGIKKKYADPDLAEAVLAFSGDYIKGQAAIARYLGKGGKDPVTAKKLQALMDRAFDEHQKGYELILKNDLAGAGKHYQAALDIDAQLMPKDWPSNQAKAMRYELSDKYAENSKIDFEHNRFDKSYVACAAGYVFSTSNPAILECLSTLENKATQLAQGKCADLKMALTMTRPESRVHQDATAKLAEKCK